MSKQELQWNFEAFRPYLTFEIMQQASAVISLFEDLRYQENSTETNLLGSLLVERTGLDWLPERETAEGINFNPEGGSVFRNKGRVFTSLGILNHSSMKNEKKLVLTDFGKRLGHGLIESIDYYSEIIKTFKYPHQAYHEAGSSWDKLGYTVKPLRLLIEIQLHLALASPQQAFLTTSEIANIAYTNNQDFKAADIAAALRKNRDTNEVPKKIDVPIQFRRNYTDIMGFLCQSPFVYAHDSSTIALNLIGKSSRDGTHFFWRNKSGESVLSFFESQLDIHIERQNN